jgi:multidrug resistance protein MdtO
MRSYVLRQPLWQELAPYPGRLAGSLRDTLGVVIALVAAMTLRVPGVALALALLFLLQRERPSLTFRLGLQILAGAALSCAASLFWVQLTDGSEVARFLGILLLIFVAVFCMESTTLPLFWTITAFYGFLDLAAWDAHRSTSSIVAASLYNLASLGIVVGSAVMVEFASGISHPAAQLEREMNRRLSDLAAFFRALAARPSAAQARRLRAARLALLRQMQAGDVHLNELHDRLRDTVGGAQAPLGIHHHIGLLTRAIEKSIWLVFEAQRHPDQDYRAVYRAIAHLCTSLAKAERPAPQYDIPDESPALAREVLVELRLYARVIQPAEEPAPARVALSRHERPWYPFPPGAFSSPDTALHALKVTLAAAACYTIYNAVSWPEILTCVVTVIFTGLTSTGAMKQKQFYRFSGAAIGGALGIAVF